MMLMKELAESAEALLNIRITPVQLAALEAYEVALIEWNSRFKKYFGIEVDKDSNGCLQDVHWSAGLMGYFPTYCLGNLYSAQFFAKAKQDIPDLSDQIASGNMAGILDWLRENIHQHGARYRAKELGEKVTGQPLSHKPLMDYMNKKFGEIYGF